MRAAIFLAFLLTACTSAEPTYYSLQPVPASSPTPRTLIIEIRHLGLPGYLDRSEIVLRDFSYKLSLRDQVRWAEPLADMMRRILGTDLALRLPGSTVIAEDGGIATKPTIRVEINVGRFEGDGAGDLHLTAQVKVSKLDSSVPPDFFDVALVKPAPEPEPAATVAGLSVLLGELADSLATNLAHR